MPFAHPIFPSFFRAWPVGLALLMAACAASGDSIFALDQEATQRAGRGGQSGGGAGGSGGQAGSTVSSAGFGGGDATHLDPNVTFNWTDTTPGTGGCAAQTMIGTFSCDVSPALLSLSHHVEGSLRLTFGSTSESQILPLTVGQLTAFDDSDQQFLMAPMTGTLDCGSNMAIADLTPTMTIVLPLTQQLAWILPTSQPTMTGGLQGIFNDAMQTMAGTVTLTFGDTQTKCDGTFNVRNGQ